MNNVRLVGDLLCALIAAFLLSILFDRLLVEQSNLMVHLLETDWYFGKYAYLLISPIYFMVIKPIIYYPFELIYALHKLYSVLVGLKDSTEYGVIALGHTFLTTGKLVYPYPIEMYENHYYALLLSFLIRTGPTILELNSLSFFLGLTRINVNFWYCYLHYKLNSPTIWIIEFTAIFEFWRTVKRVKALLEHLFRGDIRDLSQITAMMIPAPVRYINRTLNIENYTPNQLRNLKRIIDRKLKNNKITAPDIPPEEVCVICRTEEPEIKLIPCGHTCICSECYHNCHISSDDVQRCPLCRIEIIEDKIVARRYSSPSVTRKEYEQQSKENTEEEMAKLYCYIHNNPSETKCLSPIAKSKLQKRGFRVENEN